MKVLCKDSKVILADGSAVSAPTGGGVVTGTITPASRTGTLYIADLVGCTNAIIIITGNGLGYHDSTGHRTHIFTMFLNGKNVARASSNSGDTATSAQLTDGLAGTDLTHPDTLVNGTVSVFGLYVNYEFSNCGGDFVPASYTYWGW